MLDCWEAVYEAGQEAAAAVRLADCFVDGPGIGRVRRALLPSQARRGRNIRRGGIDRFGHLHAENAARPEPITRGDHRFLVRQEALVGIAPSCRLRPRDTASAALPQRPSRADMPPAAMLLRTPGLSIGKWFV